MARLLSSQEVAGILTHNGFTFVSQRGSHQKYRNAGGRAVIVPAGRREIPRERGRSDLKSVTGLNCGQFTNQCARAAWIHALFLENVGGNPVLFHDQSQQQMTAPQ